jgi:hypothetical protein
MDNQTEKAIKHLEHTIIGSRYLLETYKIAYSVNSKATTNNRELAALLANTYLRSLILTLCVIFNKPKGSSITKNVALEKLFSITFITKNDTRPDLTNIISESISIMEKEGLSKLRNKKIAHLDLEEITPPLSNSDPGTYEKLVSNAENIITEILKKNSIPPDRKPPNPETDPALQQLKKIFNLN